MCYIDLRYVTISTNDVSEDAPYSFDLMISPSDAFRRYRLTNNYEPRQRRICGVL